MLGSLTVYLVSLQVYVLDIYSDVLLLQDVYLIKYLVCGCQSV